MRIIPSWIREKHDKIRANERKIIILAVLMLGLVLAGNQLIMYANNDYRVFVGVDGTNHVFNINNNLEAYQPLTILIFRTLPGAYNPELFYLFHTVLIFVLIPFLLYKTKNHWLMPVAYYASYFPWLTDNNATIGQTIITIMLLAMFLTKNNYLRIAILLVSFGIHSSGWSLLLAWLLMLNIKDTKKYLFLVACEIPTTGISFHVTEIKNKIVSQFSITFADIGNLFTRILFLPLWYPAIKGLLAEENREWLALTIALLFVGILANPSSNLRVLKLLIIPFAIGLTTTYINGSVIMRRLIMIFLAMQFTGNLLSWLERKNILYCDLLGENALDYVDRTTQQPQANTK